MSQSPIPGTPEDPGVQLFDRVMSAIGALTIWPSPVALVLLAWAWGATPPGWGQALLGWLACTAALAWLAAWGALRGGQLLALWRGLARIVGGLIGLFLRRWAAQTGPRESAARTARTISALFAAGPAHPAAPMDPLAPGAGEIVPEPAPVRPDSGRRESMLKAPLRALQGAGRFFRAVWRWLQSPIVQLALVLMLLLAIVTEWRGGRVERAERQAAAAKSAVVVVTHQTQQAAEADAAGEAHVARRTRLRARAAEAQTQIEEAAHEQDLEALFARHRDAVRELRDGAGPGAAPVPDRGS